MNDASSPADREAADWLARLGARSVSADTLSQFETWRRTPQNAAAYRRVETVWTAAGRIGDDPAIVRSVAEALSRKRARTPVVLRGFRPGLAAVAVVLVCGSFALWTDRRLTYATGVGEVRILSLDDGSQVRLNTRSRLRVRYNAGARRVLLDRGQAFFNVATDRERPFEVEAGDVHVRALGTRFDVRRRPVGAEITLVSGAVRVEGGADGESGAGWTLRPGEQILTINQRSQESAASTRPHPVDALAVTSWTEGRLTFRATPLATAVAEVNRYSRKTIVLDAPGLSGVTVTGVFNTGDSEAFAAAARELFGLQADRSRDAEIRLHGPSSPT